MHHEADRNSVNSCQLIPTHYIMVRVFTDCGILKRLIFVVYNFMLPVYLCDGTKIISSSGFINCLLGS